MNIIINVSTYDFNTYKIDQFVIFKDKILETGCMGELDNVLNNLGVKKQYCTITDGKGCFLLPGLVAGHTHLYSTFARGWITPFSPKSFQDILDQLWWKLDRELGGDETYYSGLAGAQEFLKSGVTTVIDHHASGKLILGSLNKLKQSVVDEAGLRALFCFETSDRFNVSECIEENRTFAANINTKDSTHCRGMFGLHASYTLSDESLQKITDNIGNMAIHVHVAESKEDVDITYKKYGKSIIERFDEFGLLTPNSLIAHGVYISDSEFEIIKKRGCTMVFNPTSNMNNGVGLPPVEKAEKYGIPWIIGNDGIGYNVNRDYHNLLFSYQLKHGSGQFPFNSIQESLNRSYKYINNLLGCKIGRIEKGYDSDLILLPYDSITPISDENILGHFFYGIMDNLKPSYLWTSGNLKIKEGSIVDKLIFKPEETRACAHKLWEELKR